MGDRTRSGQDERTRSELDSSEVMTARKEASVGRNGGTKRAKTDRNVLFMHQFLVSLQS